MCLVAQSCLTLYDSMDCSPPGSSVHGILQARILEWAAISSSRDLPDPGVEPASLASPALAGEFFARGREVKSRTDKCAAKCAEDTRK